MEKKKIVLILGVLLIIGAIAFFFLKEKEIIEIENIFRKERQKILKPVELNYTIIGENRTLYSGKVYCPENMSLYNVIIYIIEKDISKRTGERRQRFYIDPLKKEIRCFSTYCGNWSVYLNGKEVTLNYRCETGNLEIVLKGTAKTI